ncbi:uncharacterized protein EDB93DRAFT_1104244 [Suillus bovinus]|uniref:uncharacterized protein n=1 Tax=Suillus bovinus TaxID=48563 RepID=UPI001B8696FD|nr:uncharacterized protein EDB93DRAFT_1104244 [Suillus bovinus]KAG2146947.1 hypothetical protein EDB93DRAFT_1104244 [Suillus bovinus]
MQTRVSEEWERATPSTLAFKLPGMQFSNKEVKFDASTASADGERTTTVEEHAIVEEIEDNQPFRNRRPPDVSTIDDYVCMLITAFRTAVLRNMGWVDSRAERKDRYIAMLCHYGNCDRRRDGDSKREQD